VLPTPPAARCSQASRRMEETNNERSENRVARRRGDGDGGGTEVDRVVLSSRDASARLLASSQAIVDSEWCPPLQVLQYGQGAVVNDLQVHGGMVQNAHVVVAVYLYTCFSSWKFGWEYIVRLLSCTCLLWSCFLLLGFFFFCVRVYSRTKMSTERCVGRVWIDIVCPPIHTNSAYQFFWFSFSTFTNRWISLKWCATAYRIGRR